MSDNFAITLVRHSGDLDVAKEDFRCADLQGDAEGAFGLEAMCRARGELEVGEATYVRPMSVAMPGCLRCLAPIGGPKWMMMRRPHVATTGRVASALT